MKYYSAIKKNMPFVTAWMKLNNMLGEINQTQKDTYCMFLLIYGI